MAQVTVAQTAVAQIILPQMNMTQMIWLKKGDATEDRDLDMDYIYEHSAMTKEFCFEFCREKCATYFATQVCMFLYFYTA